MNNQTSEPRTVNDAAVHEVAKQVSLDPGVCLVSWAIQPGTFAIAEERDVCADCEYFTDKTSTGRCVC